MNNTFLLQSLENIATKHEWGHLPLTLGQEYQLSQLQARLKRNDMTAIAPATEFVEKVVAWAKGQGQS